MLISKVATNPLAYQNRQISIAGVVRACYEKPFRFFMIEDQTGTMFSQTSADLPFPGAHIKIHGKFFVGVPEKCSVLLALLQESKREYVYHSAPCSLKHVSSQQHRGASPC